MSALGRSCRCCWASLSPQQQLIDPSRRNRVCLSRRVAKACLVRAACARSIESAQCMSGCWASPALLSGLRPPALRSSTYAAAPLATALAFRSIPSGSCRRTSSWPFLVSTRRRFVTSRRLQMSAEGEIDPTTGAFTAFGPADRLKGFDKPTVWQEFTPLAAQLKAVNLGQGYPDWPTPKLCKEAAKRAIDADFNQYCRSGGLPELVQALAKHYSPLYGREIDANTEVTVSVGVSEGLYAAFHSLLNAGDEAVLMEPAFDIYSAQIQMAGGACVYVPLRPPDASSQSWHLDWEEFERAFSEKTRVLVLNTPHNPTGKVFRREELERIAAIVQRHPRCVVIADEVYENLTYDGVPHVRIATLPGMWERTLTLCSAGKTFSVTGWKIGWLVGHAKLISGVMCCNQWVQFSIATPLQKAVADMLTEAQQPYEGFPSYYTWLRAQYERKRHLLVEALEAAGLTPYVPEGGFFIVADTSAATVPDKYMRESTPASPVMSRDWAFCRWITMEAGVAAIPPSAFYAEEHKPLAANHARFAFCKADESIVEAKARFQRLFAEGGKDGGGQ